MKKIKIILVAVITAVIILAAAGVGIYKFYLVPNYIEPALVKVTEVMEDDEFSTGITKQIKRLYDQGKLTGAQIEEYLAKHSSELKSDNAEEDISLKNENEEDSEAFAQDENGIEQQNENNVNSQLGIESVKIKDENDESSNDSRTHYYKDDDDSNDNLSSESSASDKTVSKSELRTMSADELYEKAKSIMSASDFSRAMAIKNKIDISTAVSMKNQGMDALNSYLQSALTENEYLDALDLYVKYESCLTE